jgi:hypothetical protein
MRRGSGVYVRAGPGRVAVWNVSTTHSHAQEPPERPRTLWRLPCAIVGRGLGRGSQTGVLCAEGAQQRVSHTGYAWYGLHWGAAAVRHVVLPGCVSAAFAPGSEGENVSSLSTGGDACFFRQSQRIGRAREMTRCGAAETSSGRPIHFRMHSVVQVVAWSDPCRRTTPVWGLRVVIK